MATQTDYIIGMIRTLSAKHQGEMRYSFALEERVEQLEKQILKLKKRLKKKQ